MKQLSNKNIKKLNTRKSNNILRRLKNTSNLVDFSSNDYLGFAKSTTIFEDTHQFLITNNLKTNGATGSRLLSGNYPLYNEVELMLCNIHQSKSATIFNAGYDANLGFFSCVPQRGDVILYDQFIHASIRDGIQLSKAKAYKFKHNSIEDLALLVKRYSIEKSKTPQEKNIYVVTESVFSMDGDTPDLIKMSQICKKYNVFFIVDEAHSVGVYGQKGVGKLQELNIQDDVFARIITFGKAVGCHGAAILGSIPLKQYLINFARSFIYTTALSPHALATIKISYTRLQNQIKCQQQLQENIRFFVSEINRFGIQDYFIKSTSPIHCCLIPGNRKVKHIAEQLQEKGFDIKPVLSPTVPEQKERLRFCLHTYNQQKEITEAIRLLTSLIKTNTMHYE